MNTAFLVAVGAIAIAMGLVNAGFLVRGTERPILALIGALWGIGAGTFVIVLVLA